MSDPDLLELLDSGTRRLVRTVDAMADEQCGEPSLLPGWTRAHVVAHLALNAEGLAGALEGVHEGRPVPMYASHEARDADIDDLSAASPSALRDRLLALDHGDRRVGRGARPDEPATPRSSGRRAGRTFAAGARRRDAAARGGDPPRRPGARLHRGRLAAASSSCCCSTRGPARRTTAEPFVAHATDLDRTWRSATRRPTVIGRRGALWHGGRRAGAPATD